MKLTNSQIYSLAESFNYAFANFDKYIPVKANFALQKNAQLIAAAAQEIEQARLNIAKQFGTLNIEENRYDIAPDKIEEVEKEINDLFAIEQDLAIKTLSIDAFGNTEFTPAQMSAIMFMIDEE